MIITSKNNEKIKAVAELLKSRQARSKSGLFVVEGPRMTAEIPPALIKTVFTAESYKGPVPPCEETYTVKDDVFAKMSDTKTPQGILAIVKQIKVSPHELTGPLLILENIQDPGNLGTMLRTAEAAGFGGIVMDETTVDAYSPKVVRSTMGAIFRVPFLTVSLPETAKALKKNGYEIYAAHLKGKKSFTDIGYKNKTAFIIGNEGNGLTDKAAALADSYVLIPMEGSVESLNASVAAGLLMYEWHRQNA